MLKPMLTRLVDPSSLAARELPVNDEALRMAPAWAGRANDKARITAKGMEKGNFFMIERYFCESN